MAAAPARANRIAGDPAPVADAVKVRIDGRWVSGVARLRRAGRWHVMAPARKAKQTP